MAESQPRLSALDRREQILDVAAIVFGERGYAAGTTDDIARASGISQAYVVRMFGSKEKLYIEVAQRARHRVTARFREVIAELEGTTDRHERRARLGAAYVGLVADRGVLLTLHNLFAQGHDETLGPLARECLLEVYTIFRDEGGMSPEEAVAFFSQGMLINVLLGVQLPQAMAQSSDAAELVTTAFGPKIEELARLIAPSS